MIDNEFRIEEYIELPQEIIRAYEDRKLVLFIGAGISRLMGCKGWDQMANSLIEHACNGALAEQIKNSNLDSKAKITIAKRYSEGDEGKERKFWEEFSKALKPDDDKEDVYLSIANLAVPIITTNCDSLVTRHFQGRFSVDYSIEEFNQRNGEKYVYCIHGVFGEGTKKEQDTLVFTADQYLIKYNPGGPLVSFLKQVFAANTVLFLGSGLSEFEILSAAFSPEDVIKSPKHFLLEGFFKYQQEYCNALGKYYSSIGITLLPYSKEQNGYDQQKTILLDWIDKLASTSVYYSRRITEIERALNSFDDQHKEEIKNTFSQKREYSRIYLKFILRYLPGYNSCYDWICFLIENNILNRDLLLDTIDSETKTYHESDMLLSIVACLKKYSITEAHSILLTIFVNECIQFVSSSEALLFNLVVIEELLEILVLLNISPSSNEQWILWNRFGEYSLDGGFSFISEHFKTIKKWDDAVKINIYCNVFTAPVKTWSDHKDYWLPKFSAHLIKNESQSINALVAENILTKYFSVHVKDDFYNSFLDRYHIVHYGYEYSLIESTRIISSSLLKKQKKNILEKHFAKANNSFYFQTLLHLEMEINCIDVNIIKTNPLDAGKTYVDFYYWLNYIVRNKLQISEKSKDTIAKWIEATDFGENLDKQWGEEYILIIKKKINTRKYQLFELLRQIGDKYEKNYRHYQKTDRIVDAKTPIEDMDKYFSIKVGYLDKFFDGFNSKTMSGQELIDFAEERVKERGWTPENSIMINVYQELFLIVTNKQAQQLLDSALEMSWDRLDKVLPVLCNDECIKKLNKTFINNYILKLTNKLYETNLDSETKVSVIRFVISMIGKLDNHGWKCEETFNLALKLRYDELLNGMETINSDDSITMNVLNIAECSYYRLLIEKAYNSNNLTIFRKLKKWIDDKLEKNNSVLFSLSLAFCIWYLMAIDKEWICDHIINSFNTVSDKGMLGLCMICQSRVVFKEIVDFIVLNNLIDEINNIIAPEKPDNSNADMFVSYIVAAYYFEYIDDVVYKSFISNLNDNYVSHLVWSCIIGIENADFEKSKTTLTKTYNYYHETHKDCEIDVAIIKTIHYYSVIDEDCWKLISKAMNEDNKDPAIWYNILNSLERTKEKNQYIETAIEKLAETVTKPSDYVLMKIMWLLGTLGMMDSVQILARYGVSSANNTIDIQKYIEQPELIVSDDNNRRFSNSK